MLIFLNAIVGMVNKWKIQQMESLFFNSLIKIYLN